MVITRQLAFGLMLTSPVIRPTSRNSSASSRYFWLLSAFRGEVYTTRVWSLGGRWHMGGFTYVCVGGGRHMGGSTRVCVWGGTWAGPQVCVCGGSHGWVDGGGGMGGHLWGEG